eukprot:s5331_g3.t1
MSRGGNSLTSSLQPKLVNWRIGQVRVATIASEDSASVASLRQETPRRERESWWKAASVSELKDHGDSSPLRSPQSRREVKQAMGPQRSIADIGSEGLLFFSPPSRCPQEHRFDVPATVTRRRSSPLPVPKASRETSEKCRYFCEPPRERLLVPFTDFPAAGHATQHHRRFDTPAGEEALMGRARSQTPDYHRRYAQNAAGTSLPGCSAAQVATVPESPRSSRSLQFERLHISWQEFIDGIIADLRKEEGDEEEEDEDEAENKDEMDFKDLSDEEQSFPRSAELDLEKYVDEVMQYIDDDEDEEDAGDKDQDDKACTFNVTSARVADWLSASSEAPNSACQEQVWDGTRSKSRHGEARDFGPRFGRWGRRGCPKSLAEIVDDVHSGTSEAEGGKLGFPSRVRLERAEHKQLGRLLQKLRGSRRDTFLVPTCRSLLFNVDGTLHYLQVALNMRLRGLLPASLKFWTVQEEPWQKLYDLKGNWAYFNRLASTQEQVWKDRNFKMNFSHGLYFEQVTLPGGQDAGQVYPGDKGRDLFAKTLHDDSKLLAGLGLQLQRGFLRLHCKRTHLWNIH